MRRRLVHPPTVVVAVLSLLIAACNATPAVTPAPALTDPKEIVAKGAASLTDVRTVEFTATFNGNLQATGLGAFDLSTITLAGSADLPGKAARVSLDAPSILGTKLDAILVGDTAYYKVAGALAAALHGSAEKYTKVTLAPTPGIPLASGDPLTTAMDPARLIQQLGAALAVLPVPPTKAADEKCGDLDCYRVSYALTGEQLRAFDPAAGAAGNVTIDLWTRKLDYRPAKLTVGVVSDEVGSFGLALDLRYDVGVSVAAPPADQILP